MQSYADALGVAPAELRNMRQMVQDDTMALRLDVSRRVWLVDNLKQAWKEGGIRWPGRSLATISKLKEDTALANRYRALEQCPAGSMGRLYYEHMREVGFPLPGEKGSQVETVFIHDLTHLLSGYGVDPDGEVQAASFSAGNRKKDPFTYIFFVLCEFHLLMKFSPFAEASRGRFDGAKAVAAVHRGMQVNRDLTTEWDFWADMDKPLDRVRSELNVPPEGRG